MISRKARKLLRWLSKHDSWLPLQDIQLSCPAFDDRAFSALVRESYVDSADWDTDRRPYEPKLLYYRISDRGRGLLEYHRQTVWKERLWCYVLGVLSGVTATLLVQYIPELISRLGALL